MLNSRLQNSWKTDHLKTSSLLQNTISYGKSFLIMSIILSSSQATALEIIQSPTLTMNPNGTTPLAAIVQFETDIPARVTAHISNGVESWTREFSQYMTQHDIPILGLKPDNAYSVELTATGEDNNHITISPALQAVTDSLPDDFPTISVSVSEPSRMEPGYTLIDKFSRKMPTQTNTLPPDSNLPIYSIILDNTGDVVWYSTLGSSHMGQLSNGHIHYNNGTHIVEIDLLGNIINTINLEASAIHHDIFFEGSGKILSLTNDQVEVESYPINYTDPNALNQSTLIRDTPVVEFSSNGTLLNQWNLTDILDPTRIGYYSLFKLPDDSADWSHANAVLEVSNDDSIIVSVRHQDAVVKFSKSTGEIHWILGDHSNWPPKLQPYLLTPIGLNFEWQYHQHAPAISPSGSILMFDNGNKRAIPFDGKTPQASIDSYSRAVEYSIDEQSMEIQQVWEFKGQSDQLIYSGSRGDTDWMKNTGNVLITYADTTYVSGEYSNSLGMGHTHTRIIETEHTDEADIVFEVAIYNETPGSVMLGYRSERIPDLYPLDTDNDGIPDYQDNCINAANGPLIPDSGNNSQLDTDADGVGNLCDADLNNDGLVNSTDLGLLKISFLSHDTQPNFNPDADLNGDSTINSLDLGIMRTFFSLTPQTAGFTPAQ